MLKFVSRYRLPLIVLVGLGAAWLWTQTMQSAGPADTGLRTVHFATDWKAQAEHGGFYQAIAKGYYAARGLDVQLRPGSAAINIPQLLGSGQIDFALGSNSFIALNIVQAGIPAQAVMAPFQSDPQVLIAHPERPLRSLTDMIGKTMFVSDSALSGYWLWLKNKYGFADNQIRKYTYSLAPFLANMDAIQQGYLSSEPYVIEKAIGQTPQVFLLSDYGYPSYGGLVLARNALIETQPDIVQAFVEASILGWQDYMHGDPTPANALILADNPEMTQDIIDQAIAKMKQYKIVETDLTQQLGIGAISAERWEEFFSVMSAQGLYGANLEWHKAFTTQFVNQGFGQDRKRMNK